MKKLLTVMIFSISGAIYSQKITLDELKELSTSNMDQFNSFVLNKGYDYLSSTEEKVNYFYDTRRDTYEKFVISRMDNLQKTDIIIMYMVSNKSDYLSLKNQIDKDNFKYVSSKSTSEGSYSGYSNDSFFINIFITEGIYKIYITPKKK